jgi:hypothetical protein
MSLFKSMSVVDEIRNSDNTLTEVKETPIDIIYTPQERKALEKKYEYLDPDSQYDMKVPVFSVSINSISYDDTRALNYYRTRRIKQNPKQYNDRMPIPYNIGMTLAIVAKYETHIHQISENIVPFIAPYVVVKIKENVNTLNQVPRELKIDFDGSINRDIPIEWLDTDRRTVKGELNFTIRGWIYKPLSDQPGPILHIPIRFFKSADFDINTSLFDQTEVSGPNWSN